MVEDATCPHCHLEVQDARHMFWECPCLRESTNVDILKSQWITSDALAGRGPPCFFMRGIVPKDWTFRNQEVQDKVEPIPGSDFDEVDPDGHFFLDGSGGEYSKDPRLKGVWVGMGTASPIAHIPRLAHSRPIWHQPWQANGAKS